MFLHDVQMVSVGLTATTSDHLPQFSFVSNILSNPSTQKRDWSKFNQENFILDYLDKDLHDVPQIDQQNFNLSMDSLLNDMNSILDVHAPLKKVNKYKLKFKTKPWITSALQKSISIKNNLLKKFINAAKDPPIKERYHKEYKDYRNMLSTILKQSKTNYYNHYFETDWSSIKNIWKDIFNIKNMLISLRDLLLMVPLFSILQQSQIFSATIFLQLLIKQSMIFHFHIIIFLKNRSNISFLVNPTDKTEIENVILSLDSNKSVGPNSIPTRVLKLLKNDISSQLSEIFNTSFSSGAFPSILKTDQVILVHKKDCKLDFSNYHPISLLSNIEKKLERLMYSRIYKFFSQGWN